MSSIHDLKQQLLATCENLLQLLQDALSDECGSRWLRESAVSIVRLIREGSIGEGGVEVGPQAPAVRPGYADQMKLDDRTFTAHWNGSSCDLGDTRKFKLLAVLNHEPGVYISCEDLIKEAWPPNRKVTFDAVKTQISYLKQAIRKAGIEGFAIECSKARYRLVLTSISRLAHLSPTSHSRISAHQV
jgi:DNA-binding response OmpR family regulator